jgi:membrane-associated protease RseP (regulator of RpoE activity)
MLQSTRVVTVVTTHDHTAAWLTFWAKTIAALAWPVALVCLALLFHGPLMALLEKLRDFEGWGVKASFGERVGKLADDTARVVPPPPPRAERPGIGFPHPPAPSQGIGFPDPPAPAAASGPPKFRATPPDTPAAQPAFHGGGPIQSPVEVILEGWRNIERALQAAGAAQGDAYMTDTLLISVLVEKGKLRPETLALVDQARDLRNSVLHRRGAPPDAGVAMIYFNSARSIAQAILRDAGIDGRPQS